MFPNLDLLAQVQNLEAASDVRAGGLAPITLNQGSGELNTEHLLVPLLILAGSPSLGTVNTSSTGNTVTLVTGTPFSSDLVGNVVIINGADYIVATFVSGSQITLTTNPGNQTGVPYLTIPVTGTTPAAAQLVASLPGVQVGAQFLWSVANTTSYPFQLAAGNGVTLSGPGNSYVSIGNFRLMRLVFTDVTPGSEAVTIYSLGQMAIT
jgi:hypothetical protein